MSVERIDLVLVIFAIMALCIGVYTIWSISQEPMCSVNFGIQADINSPSDLFQNVKINNIAITAPCGNDLYSMVNTMECGR